MKLKYGTLNVAAESNKVKAAGRNTDSIRTRKINTLINLFWSR